MKNKYHKFFLYMVGLLMLSGCQKNDGVESQRLEMQRNWTKQDRVIDGKSFLVLDLNGVVFNVPRAYVGQNPPNRPFFDVRTYWPDMLPLSSRREGEYESHQMIEILFEYEENPEKYPELFSVLERDRLRNRFGQPKDSLQYSGLLEYQDGPRSIFYQAIDPPQKTLIGNPLVIACSGIPASKVDEWECRVNIHYPRNIVIIYRFQKKQLVNWYSIHKGIMKLIESFKGE